MTVTYLHVIRAGIRQDVIKRYHILKERGAQEQSARNQAAAQAASASQARHSVAAYRRELDTLLAPRKPGHYWRGW